MKSVEWKTYRTRFLVKAKKLSSSLTFIDPLGRQHCGHKGDYLVESSDGVVTITPRQIFEDIYVTMPAAIKKGSTSEKRKCNATERRAPNRVAGIRMEALRIEKVKEYGTGDSLCHPVQSGGEEGSRIRRKSPQPFRPGISRMRLM